MLSCGMRRRMSALGTMGVGFYVSATIILGLVGGIWLDNKLDSKPLWTIVGLVLGIVVAFYGVYTMMRPFLGNRNTDTKKNKGNNK